MDETATTTTRRRRHSCGNQRMLSWLVILLAFQPFSAKVSGFCFPATHSQQRLRETVIIPRISTSSLGRISSQVSFIGPLRASSSTNNPNNAYKKRHPGRNRKKSSSSQTQKLRAPNNRTSLRWVIQSIERLCQDKNRTDPPPSSKLIQALQRLQAARTQREVAHVGRTLESLRIPQTEAKDVQERVIKATALAGLVSLSSTLMESLLAQHEGSKLPSSMAYVALCIALRRAGRVKRVEEFIYQLGRVARNCTTTAKEEEEGVNIVAWNTYLAALCDSVTRKRSPNGDIKLRGTSFASLEAAREWLKPGASYDLCRTEPDATSYATVLHAAACVNNQEMVDDLWKEMQERNLQPSLYAYNSLLRVICSSGPSGDDKALALLDKITNEEDLIPDAYTIDLLLLPLIRAKRMDELHVLLRHFIERHAANPSVLAKAFEAFLNSLIQGGQLANARAIADTYLLSLDWKPVHIPPTVRHFNILIEGYRRQCSSEQMEEQEADGGGSLFSKVNSFFSSPNDNSPSIVEMHKTRDKGMQLYRIMLDLGVVPDAYTTTSLLGLCASSEELSMVLSELALEQGVEVTPAVLRAAMNAYGSVGDPSSACWMFDRFSSNTMSARTWNALVGAFAKAAMIDSLAIISARNSTAAEAFNSVVVDSEQNLCVGNLVQSMSCPEAVRSILCIMDGKSRAPAANSQTYCIAASALQYGHTDAALATDLFRNATNAKIPADGRFINAVFHCFGDDIQGALVAWKNEIRRACLSHEHRTRSAPVSIYRSSGKNLIASYHGLLYVCGRALRPDIALRLVYAMNKEGIEANEVALNCYRSGKRARKKFAFETESPVETKGIRMAKQFESLLTVECTKYNLNDKRRAGERRVRIIL